MKKVYEVELAAGKRVFYGYEDFTINDKVVVNTSRGMEVGVVVGMLDELPGKASEKHMKYIACKVRVSDAQLDMKRQEKEALAKELKKMFAEKREMLLIQMFAAFDDELAEAYNKYSAVTEEVEDLEEIVNQLPEKPEESEAADTPAFPPVHTPVL